LALLDQTTAAHLRGSRGGRPEAFELCGGTPQKGQPRHSGSDRGGPTLNASPEASPLEEADGEALHQLPPELPKPSLRRGNSDGTDEMWDMDWSTVKPRSHSDLEQSAPSSPEQLPRSLESTACSTQPTADAQAVAEPPACELASLSRRTPDDDEAAPTLADPPAFEPPPRTADGGAAECALAEPPASERMELSAKILDESAPAALAEPSSAEALRDDSHPAASQEDPVASPTPRPSDEDPASAHRRQGQSWRNEPRDFGAAAAAGCGCSSAGTPRLAAGATAAEREELRRKLDRQRLHADLHDGEDLAVAPAKEARMPGTPTDFAAKLEARRRAIDDAAAAEASAGKASAAAAPAPEAPGGAP